LILLAEHRLNRIGEPLAPYWQDRPCRSDSLKSSPPSCRLEEAGNGPIASQSIAVCRFQFDSGLT
jgi:hypothetical protein